MSRWIERLCCLFLRGEQQQPQRQPQRLCMSDYPGWDEWHREAHPERYAKDVNGYDLDLGYGFPADRDQDERDRLGHEPNS